MQFLYASCMYYFSLKIFNPLQKEVFASFCTFHRNVGVMISIMLLTSSYTVAKDCISINLSI